jgi:hypothetical protein
VEGQNYKKPLSEHFKFRQKSNYKLKESKRDSFYRIDGGLFRMIREHLGDNCPLWALGYRWT